MYYKDIKNVLICFNLFYLRAGSYRPQFLLNFNIILKMKPTVTNKVTNRVSNSVGNIDKKITISLGIVVILFFVISLLIFIAIKKQTKSQQIIEDNVHYTQMDIHNLYLTQQELDLRIDSLQLMLFNTVLSSTKSEFKQNEVLLRELMKLKRENIEFRKKSAPDKQSNNFYFSNSQKGNYKKLPPKEFISTYNKNFKTIFKSYNIPKPKTKKYELIRILSVTQGILESGWGGSTLAAKYNNWHGIKCQACGGSYIPLRCNDKNSVAYNDDCEMDRFYIYSSPKQSIAAHYLLFTNKQKKYDAFITKALKKPALKSFVKNGKVSKEDFYKSDVWSLCQDLSGVYASDKQYHLNLSRLILKYELYNLN